MDRPRIEEIAMYADALVYCADADHWHDAAMYAIEFCARTGCRLTGLHAFPPSARPHPATAAEGLSGRFSAVANATGVAHARFVLAEAAVARAVMCHAAWSDLVIVDGTMAREVLREIAFTCGRPCLVVPAGCAVPDPFPGCVAIGWNGSIESMRAIHGALPLLARAERVLLIDGGNTFGSDVCEPMPCPETYLAERGIAVSRLASKGLHLRRGERLLDIAMENDADLLVLGAYRHIQYSEWDLGEVVNDVLGHTKIPLFLQH
jgi:nucleotide-binding universal stress UspA family protein